MMDYSTKQGWCAMWNLTGIAADEAWEAKQAMHNIRPDSHMVINDIAPYKSMVDGSMIMSRSKHKSHLKQHGMVEIGNEPMREKPKPKYDSDAVKREIARQLYR